MTLVLFSTPYVLYIWFVIEVPGDVHIARIIYVDRAALSEILQLASSKDTVATALLGLCWIFLSRLLLVHEVI